ncbi:MAG: hypothetical protein FWD26_08955 [Treponema sp.]|nr:hypothetical protein [Treponema sp.]
MIPKKKVIFIFILILLILGGCRSFRSYLEKFSDFPVRSTEEVEQRQARRNRQQPGQQQPSQQQPVQQQPIIIIQQQPAQQQPVQQQPAQQQPVQQPAQQPVVQQTGRNTTVANDREGFVRLILNDRTGSFSIYHLADQSFKPLFSSRDPRTSFTSVLVDGKTHRLGQSKTFNIKVDNSGANPALVFQSSSLTVTQVFSPVKTASSPITNGIMITTSVRNTSDKEVSVGLKMLIDTHLGEGRGLNSFTTENRVIKNELLLRGNAGEKYWLSKNSSLSLMGSIINPMPVRDPYAREPDFIHFANWKRLSDAPWKMRYIEGRSFNNFPFSMGDSAVCYFYDPALLQSGHFFNYTILLTTEDALLYSQTDNPVRIGGWLNYIDDVRMADEVEPAPDHIALFRVQDLLDQFIKGEIVLNENDMAEIERIINMHRN